MILEDVMLQKTAEIAANRFGLGARPGELAVIRQSPEEWLIKQLNNLEFDAKLGHSAGLVKALNHRKIQNRLEKKRSRKNSKKPEKKQKQSPAKKFMLSDIDKELLKTARVLTVDTLRKSVVTESSFQARLLDFFSNHFSVTKNGFNMKVLAPTLEREAIAQNLVGYFHDMLIAVEQHPAMLFYLNNESSIGPDSQVGKKNKRKGLNENLAREILELHTLGVDGGYSQQDVQELAMAITGWSVSKSEKEKKGFTFRTDTHQPGTRKILGREYKSQDVTQGETILRDLAKHPSTARYVCFKLARHFIADKPNPELVNAMVKTWLKTGGHLKQVLTTLIQHSESWQITQQKFKTPREFFISSHRACGYKGLTHQHLKESFNVLGQMPFNAGSPAGYEDTMDYWNGPEALMTRIDWSEKFSARVKRNALKISASALGNQLSKNTESILENAESNQQALALLLMSPEFQRR